MCEVFDPTPTAIFGIFSTYFAILGIVGFLGWVEVVGDRGGFWLVEGKVSWVDRGILVFGGFYIMGGGCGADFGCW